MNEYLHTPIRPFTVNPQATVAELLQGMGNTAFQARNLGQASHVWAQMFQGPTTIFFGLAGAMVPAGMRRVLVYLLEHRLIDCLVSTGANLFHDLHETLGYHHWQGSPHVDDAELGRLRIDRMHDVLASDLEYDRGDNFITQFTAALDQTRPYTTREYLHLLGRELALRGKEEGILTAAASARVPIYCPAVADSYYGLSIASGRARGTNRLLFDLVQDVVEMVRISQQSPATGVVYLGGGTPKNFIQQAASAGYIVDQPNRPHTYAIQITTDAPHWGGSSGATFEEAQSWDKIDPHGLTTTVYCDSTIALPLLVSALAQSSAGAIEGRTRPSFTLGQELVVEWKP